MTDERLAFLAKALDLHRRIRPYDFVNGGESALRKEHICKHFERACREERAK
ncbi:MAG: hypothetical protein VX910_02075 [Candidatus Latescibacterota bacterium]|nr:hypothetical protein [Candidatus Latescibacterota bacterium]